LELALASAGAYFGIGIIYFLAAKIRTFSQYTIGDILENDRQVGSALRCRRLDRGVAAIVSYQFRAGGYILNVITDGAVTSKWDNIAAFVILLTALGEMIAVTTPICPGSLLCSHAAFPCRLS
jgi:SSS family solute:Na+ symporter/sodium/proline symporter